MWEPKLTIDDQTRLALQELAKPYFGRPKIGRFCKAIKEILDSKFPGHSIVVVDFTKAIDRIVPTIQIGVQVDGVPDQGMIFHRAKPDGTIYGVPAND